MFAAGKIHRERVALGGNRVGKTLGIGGYETALHLTGLYPEWWPGHKFHKPIEAWAGGTKASKVKTVNQKMLVGQLSSELAGGLIPRSRIKRFTRRTGVRDAVEQVMVRHVDGWDNMVTFKSYEEGRTAFEAEAIDWIWLDEEPDKGIYDECKMRLLTTKGLVLSTLTPLLGMTELILGFMEGTDILGDSK